MYLTELRDHSNIVKLLNILRAENGMLCFPATERAVCRQVALRAAQMRVSRRAASGDEMQFCVHSHNNFH